MTKAKHRQGAQNRLIAFSHPLRAAALRVLVERTAREGGSASPIEIARELGEPTPNVSHHMKRLVALDCAELVEERKIRGAIEHRYRATERAMVETDEWEELLAQSPELAEYLVGEFMQAILDDFTTSARAMMIGSDESFHLTRTPMVLDDEGLRKGMEAHERCRLEMLEIERRSAERRSKAGTKGLHVSSCQACFEVPAPT